MSFPREFDLVAACCRWPPSAEREAAVRASAADPLDWGFLLRIAARHRVQGLVHDGLGRAAIAVPAAAGEALRADATRIARENLAFAAEAHRLRRRFEAAGIDALFLKGVTLNMLAYGTLALKRAVDIDVAMAATAHPAAVAALREAGYECLEPGPEADEAEILAWTARHKHSAWRRGGLLVELHASLVDSPDLLRGVSLDSPRQEVEVTGGLSLPTLAAEELFAYLCVHGATHGWSRLKWLADVNALLKDSDVAEVARLHRRSVELGGGRSGGQALLLCQALFGRALPERLEKALRSDSGTRHLVAVALDSMVRGGADSELDEQVLGTASIHVSHLRLMPGWRFKAAEIARKLGSTGGGPLLAFPRWLIRRARRARG
jgi:hypothetical protein